MLYFPEIKFFELFFLRIEAFRVFAYLAAIFGIIIFLSESKKRNLDSKQSWILMALAIFGLIAGARSFYYFGPWTWERDWSLLARFLRFLQFGGSGLVFYGGLLGAMAAIYIYCKIKRLNTWRYIDAFSLAAPIIIFFGRLGCFVANDSCRGIVTSLPWGVVRYTKEKIVTESLHPAVLYEALAMLILFFVLKYIDNRHNGDNQNDTNKLRFDGIITMTFLAGYAIIRFMIEFIRVYNWHFFGLTASQLISIAVFVFALIVFVRFSRKPKKQKKLNIKKRG